MSPEHTSDRYPPDGAPARRSRLVRYLAIGYTLVVVYATLYPFERWRAPAEPPFAFVLAPWPRYYTLSDVLLNVLGYVPVGFLLALALLPLLSARAAAVGAALAGTLLCLGLEALQQFIPDRVASNLDVLANGLGSLIGALLAATGGARWILSGHLYRVRQRVFRHGAPIDVGFLVLLLWLFTQFNPEVWLFGNGDFGWLVPVAPNLKFSPASYRWLETGVTAANLAAICLFTTILAKDRTRVGGVLLALVLLALALKSAAALTLFVPGDAGLWLTPGSLLGVPAGLLLFLALLRLPRRAAALACIGFLVVGMVLVNIAPDNPYLEAAVQTWQHGHFLSFSGLTRLVSTLWPAAACAYLIWLLRWVSLWARE